MLRGAKKRIRELEAMLRCSEEWVEYWTGRAVRAEAQPDGGESYAIDAPWAVSGGGGE
jgi:hypothetical protein